MLGSSRKSPASFNPMALASGADHVALASVHMADCTAFIFRSNNASAVRGSKSHCTGKYVILAALLVQWQEESSV